MVRSVVAEVIRHVKGLDHFWVPNTPGPVRWLIPFLLEKVGLSRLLVPGWSVNEMDAVVHALDRCNGHELNEVISRLSHYRARRGSNSGDGNEAAAAATAAASNVVVDDDDNNGDDDGEAESYFSLAIYKVTDVWPSFSRSRLLKFLCEDRLCDLNVRSRALLLHALQLLQLSAHERGACYVKHILTRWSGRDVWGELVRLKLEMDAKGDYHSLHKLLFVDMIGAEDLAHREEILLFFEEEAKKLQAKMRQGGRGGRLLLHSRPWRKVLSDIDDTLKCSFGKYPAGSDQSLPRKALYPGVLGLYRELDLGCTDVKEWAPPTPAVATATAAAAAAAATAAAAAASGSNSQRRQRWEGQPWQPQWRRHLSLGGSGRGGGGSSSSSSSSSSGLARPSGSAKIACRGTSATWCFSRRGHTCTRTCRSAGSTSTSWSSTTGGSGTCNRCSGARSG